MNPLKKQEEQNKAVSGKKWFTFSNISTAVLLVFILTLFVSPDAKGWLIQNLMKIGLFQPDVPRASSDQGNEVAAQPAPAQEVIFSDDKGNSIKLSEQKGKVVFINFWATWCPPCIAEMPSIDRLYAKYKNNKDVLFIMVDVDGKYEQSSAFMKKGKYSLPVSIPASEIPTEYFAGSMPTTVILDKSGKIAFHHVGGADYSNPEVAAFIDKLSK